MAIALSGILFIQSLEAKEVELGRDYWEGYILDARSIFTSPLRWGRSDWIKASFIAGITVGLYASDQKIQDWMQENRSDTSNKISNFARPFGEAWYTLPSLGAFYLCGEFVKNEKVQRTALLGIESYLLSTAIIQTIKFTGHRHRPNTGDSHNKWDGPGFSTSNLSFPSQHSSSAFSIATVIASEYGDKKFIPILAYGIATLTVLSRVNDNYHWASDVFFGSAVGYFTAKAIVKRYSIKKDTDITFLPAITDGKYSGLSISCKF